jgi:hypothetical protein
MCYSTLLKFLILFNQRVKYFHFAQGLTNYRTDPTLRFTYFNIAYKSVITWSLSSVPFVALSDHTHTHTHTPRSLPFALYFWPLLELLFKFSVLMFVSERSLSAHYSTISLNLGPFLIGHTFNSKVLMTCFGVYPSGC